MQIRISWLLQKPTDLDLHCLQRQGISGFSRTRVKCTREESGVVDICPDEGHMKRKKVQCPIQSFEIPRSYNDALVIVSKKN